MNSTEQNQHFDVGGQAVMEGVMMRSPTATAVTVRRPDGTMVTKLTPFVPLKQKHPWMGKPFIRGIINMGTMLYYGMNTLEDSTKMLGILDEEPTKFEKWLAAKLGKGIDKIVMAVAIILAELEMDKETIAAALLHDVLEDTDVSETSLRQEFGDEVTLLTIDHLDIMDDKFIVQGNGDNGLHLSLLRNSSNPHIRNDHNQFLSF